jgi:hypothetical protein
VADVIALVELEVAFADVADFSGAATNPRTSTTALSTPTTIAAQYAYTDTE